MNSKYNEEVIELALPLNPAYVSAARLTASSIANRMNFAIEDIEDVKSAVSEACTYLIRQNFRMREKTFRITFTLKNDELDVCFLADQNNEKASLEDEEDYGLMMLRALVDTVDISNTTDNKIIILLKKIKKTPISLNV